VARTESSRRESIEAPIREFFIVGCPRSGTTLLRWMLDSHPVISVTPETHFGVDYVSNRGRFGPDGEPSSRRALLDDFCRSDGFKELAIDEREFRIHAQADPKDPWLPLRAAMGDFGRLRKAKLVGEKTPSHALHVEALSQAFPESRFLLLRRDPRAVVASWHRTAWSKRTSTEVSELWRRSSRSMSRAYRALPGRCLEIRYEELVSNPTPVLKSVCALLDTNFDRRMLSYHERDASVCDRAVDDALTFEPPTPSRIDAWRMQMSARELRRIEMICGREMVEFGYARDTSISERLWVSIAVLPGLWRKRLRRRLRGRRTRSVSEPHALSRLLR